MTVSKYNRQTPRETCPTIIQCAKWIPVLLVLVIVGWVYYAYIYELCFVTIKQGTKRYTYITFFHILFLVFIWSYFVTVCTKNGEVPSQFRLPESEYDRLVHADSEEMQRFILETFCHDLPNLNRTLNGSVRFCDKCRQIKPDRAHHCSVCGECVLKMDHHCPWINNCVSFSNYKFFILFLTYSLILSVYIAGTTTQYFVMYWQGELDVPGKFHIVFAFFVAVMFTISLISLFSYHCYLILNNRTTLEAFAAPIFISGQDKNAYNLGKTRNFLEVFGNDPKLWFIPVFTSLGNGYTFPLRPLSSSEESLIR